MQEFTPFARVRADEDSIDVVGHGCTVPATFGEARALIRQMEALLLVFDPDGTEFEAPIPTLPSVEWLDDPERWYADDPNTPPAEPVSESRPRNRGWFG